MTKQLILYRIITCLSIFILLSLLSACSTLSNKSANPQDPFEPFNRQCFNFNRDIDEKFFQPVAKTYKQIVPWQVRTGIMNVFSNINDIPAVVNDLLQFNPKLALADTSRVLINSTIGWGGLFDVASKLGIAKHPQDFGITLARWGWRQSTYLVLPIFGPSTVRDGLALPMNYYVLYPITYVDIPRQYRYAITATQVISYRSALLGVEAVVDEAALDPYVFFRDAYLQKRRATIALIAPIAMPSRPNNTMPTKAPKLTTEDNDIDLLTNIDTNSDQ